MSGEDEYESLVEQARTRTKAASKDYIPKCCEILRKQGVSPEKITHRIRKDFGFWGLTTIYEAIPDEYKKETKPKNLLEERIPPPESILLEQSTSDTQQIIEPPREPEPKLLGADIDIGKLDDENTKEWKRLEEATKPRSEPEPLKRKHEEAFLPLPLAEQLNKFLLARLIGMARSEGLNKIRLKINDQGELYVP